MAITIQFQFEIDGVATNVTSAVLSDITGTYGVKRDDTDAVVVADGTAMTNVGVGQYEYSFTAPANALTYTWVVEYVYDGTTYYDSTTYTDSTKAVSLGEAKAQLRITGTTDDTLINRYIDVATAWAEAYTNRKFLTATCTDYLDDWPKIIRPKWSPLLTVSSLKYYDTNNVEQTWGASNYQVEIDTEPGRIAPVTNVDWPELYDMMNPITLTYTAGYGTEASDVPQHYRNGILMLVGHLYENREASAEVAINTVPYGVLEMLGIGRLVSL